MSILRPLRKHTFENHIVLTVNAITNGTLFTHELLDMLSDFDISFQVTIDGPANVHDEKRRFKDGVGSYRRILEGLKALYDRGFAFAIRVNVAKDNIDHIGWLMGELQQELGSGLAIRFTPLIASSDLHSDWASLCLQREEFDVLPELWGLSQQFGHRPLLRPLLNLLPCPAMNHNTYILDSSGHIYKCEAFAGLEEFRAATIDGDGKLTEPTFVYYEWMAANILDCGDCHTCALLPACGGECPAVTRFCTGNLKQTSCSRNKRVIEANIRYQLRTLAALPLSL